MDFDTWLEIITRLDATAANSGQYVIGSIILADLDAAVDMAQQMAAAGVRILEFNIGTPYGDEAAGVVTTERAGYRNCQSRVRRCLYQSGRRSRARVAIAALAHAARAGGAETVVLMGRSSA